MEVLVTSGGLRNRSGAVINPNSGRSERRGISFQVLDVAGYKGQIPPFPLGRPEVYDETYDAAEKRKVKELDQDASQRRLERELELWEWAWRTPQAIAWAREPWRWHGVAMWVRTAAICESAEAMAADKNSLHRFADQVGLTPAGLSENAWQISGSIDPSQVEPVVTKQGAPRESSRSRLPSNVKVVKGGGR